MITIKLLNPDDCPEIVKWNDSTGPSFLQQWSGRAYTYPLTEEQIKNRISNSISVIKPAEYTYKACYGADDEMIGTIELFAVDYLKKECKVGRFLIKDKFQNKGLGKQILKEIITKAFYELNLEIFHLSVFEFNKNAIKCYQALGFNEYGKRKCQLPDGGTAEILDMMYKIEKKTPNQDISREKIQPSKVAMAVQLFRDGRTCSQAILAVYGQPLGLSRQTAMQIASGFSAGMRLGEICGAVTGAFMVLGLRHAGDNCEAVAGRAGVYKQVVEYARRFQQRNGSTLCRELLGYDISTPEGMKQAQEKNLFKTACIKMVEDAASILEEIETESQPAVEGQALQHT